VTGNARAAPLEGIPMPHLLPSAAALALLSALGVALLAPMAVRSVSPVPAHEIHALLPAAPVTMALSARASSDRTGPETLSVSSGVEAIAAQALPIPASISMEATIYAIPKPPPAPIPKPPPAPLVAAPAPEAAAVDASVSDPLAPCELLAGGN